MLKDVSKTQFLILLAMAAILAITFLFVYFRTKEHYIPSDELRYIAPQRYLQEPCVHGCDKL